MYQLQEPQVKSDNKFLDFDTISSPAQSTNVSPSSRISKKGLSLGEDLESPKDQPSTISSITRPQRADLLSHYVAISVEFWSQKFNKTFGKLSSEKSAPPSKSKMIDTIQGGAPIPLIKELGVLNSINFEPKMRLGDNLAVLSEQKPDKSIKREKWGPVEDQTLLKLAIELNEDWQLIAQRLSRFKVSAKVLRDHHEKLQTQILPEKRRFTEDEDVQILKYYKKFGPKWKLIASKLYRRTSASIKSRFYSNLRYRIKTPLHSSKANSNADTAAVVTQTSHNIESEAEASPDIVGSAETWESSFIDIDHFLYSDKKNSSPQKSQGGCHFQLEVEEDLFIEDDDEGYEPKKKLKTETSRLDEEEDLISLSQRKVQKQLEFDDQCLSDSITSYDENLFAKFITSETEEEKKMPLLYPDEENQQKNSQDVIKGLQTQVNTLVSSLMDIYDQIQNELDKASKK